MTQAEPSPDVFTFSLHQRQFPPHSVARTGLLEQLTVFVKWGGSHAPYHVQGKKKSPPSSQWPAGSLHTLGRHCSHPSFRAVPPPDLCTCCCLCPHCSLPRSFHGWHLLIFQGSPLTDPPRGPSLQRTLGCVPHDPGTSHSLKAAMSWGAICSPIG